MPSDPFEFPILKDPEEFHLHQKGKFADLIEEEGPLICDFEEPLLGCNRVRKGPFHMAEQFALDQRFGNGSAVECDKGAVLSGAAVMDGLGNQLFSRSAFSRNQDIGLGGSHLIQEIVKGQHLGTLANDIIKMVAIPDRPV